MITRALPSPSACDRARRSRRQRADGRMVLFSERPAAEAGLLGNAGDDYRRVPRMGEAKWTGASSTSGGTSRRCQLRARDDLLVAQARAARDNQRHCASCAALFVPVRSNHIACSHRCSQRLRRNGRRLALGRRKRSQASPFDAEQGGNSVSLPASINGRKTMRNAITLNRAFTSLLAIMAFSVCFSVDRAQSQYVSPFTPDSFKCGIASECGTDVDKLDKAILAIRPGVPGFRRTPSRSGV
jgi:hypothetical protein